MNPVYHEGQNIKRKYIATLQRLPHFKQDIINKDSRGSHLSSQRLLLCYKVIFDGVFWFLPFRPIILFNKFISYSFH